MSKVFILSDFYSAQVLIRCLDCISNIGISEIILLRENHRDHSIIWDELPFKLSILKTIEDCILESDVVIVLNNSEIPDCTVDYTRALVNKCNKILYELQTPDFIMDALLSNYKSDYYKKLPKSSNLSNCVNILVLNMGALSLCTYVELMLRKILVDYNVSVYQFYSENTSEILGQMESNNLLDKTLFNKYHIFKPHNVNMSIITIDVGYNLQNIALYSQYIKEISPDFVAVINSSNNNSKEIRNYVKYNLERSVDILLFSPFYLIDKKHIINTTSFETLDEHEFYITEASIMNVLQQEILTKLSFPYGISLQ